MSNIFEIIHRIYDVKKYGGELYIRCAGIRGQEVANELRKANMEPSAFLDIMTEKDLAIKGIKVENPNKIYNLERGKFFILIAVENSGVYDLIETDYKKHGLVQGKDYADFSFCHLFLQRMGSFRDIFANYDFRAVFESVAKGRMCEAAEVLPAFNTSFPKVYNLIPNLDVPLTTCCNLRCSYCSHAIPLAKKRHFLVDDILNDLEKLLAVSYVNCLAIMGGEPFIYPLITEFIQKYNELKNKKNIGFTRVVTNGTILPDDDFFMAYKEIDNAYIYISNYGDVSNKLELLCEKAEKYGVKTYLCPPQQDWQSLGDCSYDRNYSEEDLKHLYAVCGAHTCVQLFDGHLYTCGRVPVLNEDGVIPYAEGDFCEVRNSDALTLGDRLHKYLFEKPYLEGCRYCDGQHQYSRKIRRGE